MALLVASCGDSASDDDSSEASTPQELAYAYCLAQFDDRYTEVVEAELVDGVPIDREQMAADFEACVADGYSGSATDLAAAHCEGFYDPALSSSDCDSLFEPQTGYEPLEHLEERVRQVIADGIADQLPA
jgi:hypothetical protein